jgi:hypothetical protein
MVLSSLICFYDFSLASMPPMMAFVFTSFPCRDRKALHRLESVIDTGWLKLEKF